MSARKLAEMVAEATVDAYDESEQTTGWFTMFENYLELPFETEVLGARVTVDAIDQRDGGQLVAVCRRGKKKVSIGLVDLPLPSPRPEGADWIEAYRHWLKGSW
ncbi:MAG: calcium-binding protein [Polyangiaceae bacterium]